VADRPEPNLSVGDLVVIEEKNLQRGLWPIGVVEGVVLGEDGVVRVVRTNRGVLRRSTTKIHPFYRVMAMCRGNVMVLKLIEHE
jgi:hypothetical protein